MSSEALFAKGSNIVNKEELQSYSLSSYQFATKKLSSLISCQKHGEKQQRANMNLQNYPLSSYEFAMEKLSSLITFQKRGEKPQLADKLERTMMYLKVLLKHLPSMFEWC